MSQSRSPESQRASYAPTANPSRPPPGRASVAPWRGWDPRGSQPPPASNGQRQPLLVVAPHGPAGTGALRSLTEVLRRLLAFRPTVVTQRESSFTRQFRALGFGVEVWPDLPGSGSALNRALVGLRHNARTLRLLRRTGARLVHCNDLPSFLSVAPAARLAGARVLLNVRTPDGVVGPKWRTALHLADSVVCLSASMAEHVRRQLSLPEGGALSAKMKSIYSIAEGIPLGAPGAGERPELRADLGIAQGDFAVGVVGLLHPHKQQLELLEYLRQNLLRYDSRIKFHFIGEINGSGTDYGRRCEALLWSAPASFRHRVRLAGHQTDMRRWYRALDCVLVGSAHEGLSRPMIEALSWGCPVVSFDVCSAREILEDHGGGVVVPQGDYAGLLAACSRLAQQPEEASRLGDVGARVAVRLFGPESVVRSYERLYCSLAGSAPKLTIR